MTIKIFQNLNSKFKIFFIKNKLLINILYLIKKMYSNRQYDKNPTFTHRHNNINLIDLQSTISLNWKTFSDFIHNQIKNSSDNESKKKNK